MCDKSDYSKMTFNDLWLEYIKYKKLQLKAQSFRSVESRFKKHILPFFKDFNFNEITNSVYIKWQEEIEKKGFKHKYNSSLHGAMVNILNYAIRFYVLKDNIATLTGNFKRKNELKKNVNFWTIEEFQKFINCVDDFVYKTFFETLYYTGLRQGEALALNWNDFKNEYLDIEKIISKEMVDNKHINTPKANKSIKQVQLDDELISKLNELKKFYQGFVDFNDDGGLNPLSLSTIGRKKDKYCEIAEVKKIRIHDFRHSHASLLLSMNVPITVISERLGHSDINMTLNTYSHMIPKDEDKVVNILNQIKQNK